MSDAPTTRRSIRASHDAEAQGPKLTANGPSVSTLLATAVVVAWAGIIGPAFFTPSLQANLPPMWWIASFGYLACSQSLSTLPSRPSPLLHPLLLSPLLRLLHPLLLSHLLSWRTSLSRMW